MKEGEMGAGGDSQELPDQASAELQIAQIRQEADDQIASERQQLKASEERFKFMAESIPQKIFTVRPDGSFSYFNPQWQSYTGIAISRLMADTKTWLSIIDPNDLEGVGEAWKESFAKHRQVEYEFRIRRKDGEYRWHFGRIRPMKSKQGDIIVWVGSVTDIHDMKVDIEQRHELELKTTMLTEQRAQLIAVNQAKDEFISLVSHQLRTPATGVKQYLDMLLGGYVGSLTPEQKSFVQTAYDSNERQINIVNDMLQVARIDAGKITLHQKKTNLVQLAKSVLNEHSSQCSERQQTVVFKSKDDTLHVTIDADRMYMALDNIVDNASKYTPNGKSIMVSVGRHGDKAYIAVSDEGIGIAPADINIIFQKFSRLENPHAKGVDGSGLGLYWVQKIVSLHGGIVKVSSRLGKGTTVTIELSSIATT
jgi:PAS domain S-box-containing protein